MEYSNKISTTPYWSGSIINNETVWPVDTEKDCKNLKIKMLYPIKRVISVYDSRLEKFFKQGKDYDVEDGELVIIRGGDIAITPWGEFQLDHEQTDSPFKIGCTLGGWLYFGEGNWITKRQYAVTYEHDAAWDGFIPSKSAKLPRTHELLKKKSHFNFAFFGDSIAYGCNSSGMKDINEPPYAPIWAKMTVDALNERGGNVGYVNRAVGGMDSAWGAREAYNLFKDDKPDLFLIAFGMNDGDNTNFGANTEKMMQDVLTINPDCEFLLVSTTLPHRLAAGFFREQDKQQSILEGICEKYGDIAELIPMTDVHASLMEKKRYFDMTGNNVNHPNDFLAAVYAQTILTVLGE